MNCILSYTKAIKRLIFPFFWSNALEIFAHISLNFALEDELVLQFVLNLVEVFARFFESSRFAVCSPSAVLAALLKANVQILLQLFGIDHH